MAKVKTNSFSIFVGELRIREKQGAVKLIVMNRTKLEALWTTCQESILQAILAPPFCLTRIGREWYVLLCQCLIRLCFWGWFLNEDGACDDV